MSRTLAGVQGEVKTVTSCLSTAPYWMPRHIQLKNARHAIFHLKAPVTWGKEPLPLGPHQSQLRLPGIVLGWSFLSHCCCNPVLFWLRLSGRRQEILVTLTAAAPFLLSSCNDVDGLWWHEVRNWATAKVRKIGQCLCHRWAGDPAEVICFLPFYTVSLSVPLFIMQSQSILFSKHLTVLPLRNSCVRQFF